MDSARLVEMIQYDPFNVNERHPPLCWFDIRSDQLNINQFYKKSYRDFLLYIASIFAQDPKHLLAVGVHRPKGHPGDTHWLPFTRTGVNGMDIVAGLELIFNNYLE